MKERENIFLLRFGMQKQQKDEEPLLVSLQVEKMKLIKSSSGVSTKRICKKRGRLVFALHGEVSKMNHEEDALVSMSTDLGHVLPG